MKILHTVESYAPSRCGVQQVVQQLSERLVKRGHEVTVATRSSSERTARELNGVQIAEFDISGSAVWGIRGEVGRYREFLLNGNFDLMMNYAAQQWATDLVFDILDELGLVKVMAPCGFSGLFHRGYASYFQRLPETLSHYDWLIFHSSSYRDIAFARQFGIEHCSVIPNGAAVEEFGTGTDNSFRRRYQIPSEVHLILTVGAHTGLKGHGLTIKAFRKAEIGRAVLVVIGNISDRGCYDACVRMARWTEFISRGHKRVLLLDPPRAEVIDAFKAADLFVLGSMVECSPLVLFESMAAGTPFVTLSCGNAEETASWGNGGVVVPSTVDRRGNTHTKPATLAAAIEAVVNNPIQARQLGEAGLRAWREHFDWEKITSQYEQLYQMLVQRRLAREEADGPQSDLRCRAS